MEFSFWNNYKVGLVKRNPTKIDAYPKFVINQKVQSTRLNQRREQQNIEQGMSNRRR